MAPTYQLGFFDCSTVWQYVAATYCHICLNGLPHILARQTFYSLSYIHLDPGNLFQLSFWYLRGEKNSDFAYCYKGFFLFFKLIPEARKLLKPMTSMDFSLSSLFYIQKIMFFLSCLQEQNIHQQKSQIHQNIRSIKGTAL